MILLKNATYIDWKTLNFHESDILVEEGPGGKIQFVSVSNTSPDGDVKENTSQVIDCKGMLVTKSFANGHHHAYSALSRGMPSPAKSPADFTEILKYIWWTLDKCLDRDMIRASGLVTAIASAKAGATFVIDHHASPFTVRGSLDILASAFEEVGVSHLLCYEISDRDGLEIAREGLEETQDYLTRRQGLVGLHASFTLGDNTLEKAAELMDAFDSGIHIHVAEDTHDEIHCLKNHGKTVIERLDEYGFLGSSKTILGHCLHLDGKERDILRNSKAWVVQNTESNLNNKVGFFNSEGLGERIMLGTDGMHSDMLRSAKAAFYNGQFDTNMSFPLAYERFRKVHEYIRTNSFSGDGENNLVILDYSSPTPVSKENFIGHFIFGLEAQDIKHVISSGKLIVKDRIVQTVNEQEVMKNAREMAVQLWRCMHRSDHHPDNKKR